MNRLALTVTASPIQRVASTRMKCPLENSSTSPCTACRRCTTQSARAEAWAGASPSWPAVAEQEPAGTLGLNLGGAAPLILAVVPFDQITIHCGHRPEAGQLTGPGRALQGTGIHLGERQAAQPFPELAGVALAALGQRQVGQSRVLAREAPSRLAMPSQVNDRQLFTHALVTPTTVSGCAVAPGWSLLAAIEDIGVLALASPTQPWECRAPSRPRSYAGAGRSQAKPWRYVASIRPLPLLDFRFIDAVLVGVVLAADLPVAEFLLGMRPSHLQGGDAGDDVDGQAKAVDLVLNGEIERRVDVALLLLAAHVQVVVICAAI